MADLRFLPDLDALVAPLPGASPGGSKDVYWELSEAVEKLRTEVNPDFYDKTDPQRPKEFRPADWAGVVELCLPALRDRAKDLAVAGWVVDALPRREELARAKRGWDPDEPPPGFAALADGLTLLRRLTAARWDDLLPALDPDDLEGRNTPFNWLGTDNAGAALPQFVRSLPLAVTPGGAVSERDWTAKGADRAELTKLVRAADSAHLREVKADIDRCRGELAGLLDELRTRLTGPDERLPGETKYYGPILKGLRDALDACHLLADGLLGAVPLPEPQGDPGGGNTTPSPPPPAPAAATPATREAAYAQLRAAAELLRKLEPHSPVPFLVLRAVALGTKPFHEMIRSFVRSEEILAEIHRELDLPAVG